MPQSSALIRAFSDPRCSHGFVHIFPRAFPLISDKAPPNLHPQPSQAFQDLVESSVQLTWPSGRPFARPFSVGFPALFQSCSHFHSVKPTRSTTVTQSVELRGTNGLLISLILTVFVRLWGSAHLDNHTKLLSKIFVPSNDDFVIIGRVD